MGLQRGRFSDSFFRMIRSVKPHSKLCLVKPDHATVHRLAAGDMAQLGKDGGHPLPLHPSPVPPLAATETVPVSEPSAVRP
jgi:hypothetical protein